MKKISIPKYVIVASLVVVYIGFFGACCAFFNRMDNVAQTEESVRKYGELSAFFDTGCVFVKGRLNVDNNVMRCTFRLGDSKEALLAALEGDGWRYRVNDIHPTFVRNSPRSPMPSKTDTLEIVFNPDNTLDFIWK